MTLTFSSLEDAWGGVSLKQPEPNKEVKRDPGFTNVSKNTASAVHSATFNLPPPGKPKEQKEFAPMYNHSNNDNNYENIYCGTIINHVQACAYCQERLRNVLGLNKQKERCEEVTLSQNTLKRNHDNLAYVPFGLEPEVFNILLFSMILISLIFLIDKKGLKSFKF